MKTTRSRVAMFVLLAFVCSTTLIASAIGADSQIEVKSLISEQMPIKIESAVVTQVEGKPMLTMSVARRDARPVSSLQLFMLIFSAEGEVRGGEGWAQNVGLADASTDAFTWKLQSEPQPGDRIVLSVEKVTGQDGVWWHEEDYGNFKDAVVSHLAGREYVLPEVRFTPTPKTRSGAGR